MYPLWWYRPLSVDIRRTLSGDTRRLKKQLASTVLSHGFELVRNVNRWRVARLRPGVLGYGSKAQTVRTLSYLWLEKARHCEFWGIEGKRGGEVGNVRKTFLCVCMGVDFFRKTRCVTSQFVALVQGHNYGYVAQSSANIKSSDLLLSMQSYWTALVGAISVEWSKLMKKNGTWQD